MFARVTGNPAPPSPISARTYADAGLPFFRLPEEASSGIQGRYSSILSISELKRRQGQAAYERELNFPVIKLDGRGRALGFRPLAQLLKETSAWGISSI